MKKSNRKFLYLAAAILNYLVAIIYFLLPQKTLGFVFLPIGTAMLVFYIQEEKKK